MSQSNTQQGQIVLPANTNLKGKEGLICQITKNATTGAPSFHISAHQDYIRPMFVITDGDEQGKSTAAMPISPDRSIRVKLTGTCEAGDIIVTAPVGSTGGQVRKMPTSGSHTFAIVGVAEEDGVSGQLVKIRPHRLGEQVTIS